MTLSPYLQEVAKRRTFAIISHPDAGKTTITEKVLLFGQAIQTAGTVKGRGSSQHAKSDWMEMEKQRGISITTSVMQFPYHDCLVNLLDTPGHEDFSEDTYRTLTAVDCCLMVIDAAKGVEDRTRKLMEVTRLRDTPILTFMNKLDRDIRDPMELMDEVENELKIACAPITWPIGCGKLFKGVYHLYKDETYLYQTGKGHTIQEVRIVKGLDNPELDAAVGEELAAQLRDELELVKGASHEFDRELFLSGSKNERLISAGLSRQSTYGIMADCPEKRLRDIIDHLCESGYMTAQGDEYPILKLAPKSRGVLTGQETLRMMLEIPQKKKAAAVKDALLPPADEKLLAALKDLRKSLAMRQSIPAYVVFTDATLIDMCRLKPKTQEEFMEVSGVGQAKSQRYGEVFLAVIAEFSE